MHICSVVTQPLKLYLSKSSLGKTTELLSDFPTEESIEKYIEKRLKSTFLQKSTAASLLEKYAQKQKVASPGYTVYTETWHLPEDYTVFIYSSNSEKYVMYFTKTHVKKGLNDD